MRNTPIQETPLAEDALRPLADLLPASWRLERLETGAGASADRDIDAVVVLIGPGREKVRFAVEAKRSGLPTGLLLTHLREQARRSDLPLLYVSDYIGPSLRDTLASEGISYADATGWVRITSTSPLVLLTGQGAKRSPRAGRPTAVLRLDGIAAGRTIRALAETDPPCGVRDLAAIAQVSPGSVSKLLPTLATEGIIDRDERGTVTAVRRRALIQRWAVDYSFAKVNKPVGYYLAPRGLERTLARLPKVTTPTTLTGSAAARQLLAEGVTPVVPLRLLAIYTNDPSAVAMELRLIPADPETANTVVAVPQDGDVLNASIAPIALVLADLVTLPGRGDAEAGQLMDMLARGDKAWVA